MQPPLAWRPATTVDVPDLVTLVQAAYRGPGGWTNEIAIVEGKRIGPAQARVAIEDPGAVTVLVHDPGSGRLIGCCHVSAGPDETAHALARRFIADGFQARVVCVDTTVLDPSLVGRVFDEEWLAELPPGVDPCGENGEFSHVRHRRSGLRAPGRSRERGRAAP